MTNELVDSVTRWSEQRPTSLAVELNDQSISYRDLDVASASLAATMRCDGLVPGDRVVVWLRKSIEAVVTIYAALRCGAAYVPVDSSAPVDRVRAIIASCAPSLIVADRDALILLPAIDRHEPVRTIAVGSGQPIASGRTWEQALRGNPAAGVTADVDPIDPCYVLYTSGSTGTPKGVTLSHRNALAFVSWAVEQFALGFEDRVSNHAPFHFDLSVLDLFATARAGGCVCLIPESQVGRGAALNSFVLERGITVWYSVPSALTRMLEAANSRSLTQSRLRTVLFAGEVFPSKHLARLRSLVPQAELFNLYGPTETNVCTFHRVNPDAVGAAPIGQACPYATTFLLDGRGQVLDHRLDQVGELCVIGDSVMLGYWNDPDLTDRTMVTVGPPGAGSSRAYRTGDIVRIDHDLNYVFCGREDDMVKIRGHRVELGEIESVLMDSAAVAEAVCLARPDGSGALRLEAHVVPSGPGSDESTLRRHCSHALPRYMVPDAIHLVSALPRGATGKIDRRALAAEEEHRHAGLHRDVAE